MNQRTTHSSIFSRVALEVPNLFASYRIGDYPRAGLRCHPWKMTGTQAVLVNAFDLLANKRTRVAASKIREKHGTFHENVISECRWHSGNSLREFVEFAGPLMLDSGAFNFQKQTEISIDPLNVLKIGIELGVDISVVLDHPFLPNAEHEEISTRWATTLDNTRRMFEKLEVLNGDIPNNLQLMPVLHGHDADTLERSFDDIVKIWRQEPPFVGIGSLAPLARNGSKRMVIDIICKVRQLLPDSHIHCFSMGSALLMLFAFYCGADTVDSQSWMLSAAFKNVQLPGLPWTRFSSREKAKDPDKYEYNRHAFAKHLLQLIDEEAFAVKNWDNENTLSICDKREALSYLDSLEHRDGKNNIHFRACHNLYAFNFEANRVRQEKKKGASSLETFIEGRLKSPVYQRIFQYAVEQVQSKP